MTEPSFTRFPPDGPLRRAVWLLVALVALMLIANLAHQGGVG